MANFCKFCGQPLENGACNCEGFKNANVATQEAQPAPQQTPVAPQETPVAPQETPVAPQAYQQAPQGYQQAPQGYQQAPYAQPQPQMPNPTVEMIKKTAKECVDLCVNVLKAPGNAFRMVDANPDKKAALSIGALHLLILFFLPLINFLGMNDFMKAGARAKLGLGLVGIAVVGILLATLAGFLLGKKQDASLTFVRALANFCVATVPGSALFILNFIFGLFAPGIAILLLVACVLAWVIFSQEAMNVNMKGNPIAAWVNWCAVVVAVIIIFLVGKSIVTDLLTAAIRSSMYGFY